MSIQRIKRRDGSTRYLARFYDHDGHQRGRVFRTRAEARAYESKAVLDRNHDPRSGATLLSDYADEWLEGLNLRPNTVTLYRAHLRRTILPALGGRRLNQIKRSDIQRMITKMRDGDYAARTIRTCFSVLRALLADAVEEGLIAVSPARGVSLPEVVVTKEITPLAPDDVQTLAESMPPRYAISIWLAVGCGLRLSECLGLTTDRIDFLRREIHVDRQLQGGQLSPLKTRSSRRVVPVDDFILTKITQHMQAFKITAIDNNVNESGDLGLLITSKVGKPVIRSVFEACFRKAVARAGLPPTVTFHSLRHTFCSLLIASGMDVLQVQRRMGHAHATETLNIYGHLFPSAAGAGRGVIEAAFSDRGLCEQTN